MMIQIDRAVVSIDVIEKKFCCNVAACKGMCCVHGDSGAPLEDEEIETLISDFQKIKAFMRPEGIEQVEKQGIPVIDSDNDKVTPLVGKEECAFVIFENGIAKCAIEKAYFKEKTSLRKPVSCHLYPIRIKKYKDFDAVNYDTWDICKPALKHGNDNSLAIYQFVKDALIRKYGQQWYDKLCIAANSYNKGKILLNRMA